ncbi:MAG: bifunctional D-glycero-beta-D-manno-heptose-7-phosphate kinase/D-glycero-beta-D-manno-heptose 1-phosphate adenylyltransferase HldE, partial [Gammaproteobacteria bacterium]
MRLIVPPFESASVLIAGDVMLDRYWTGPSSRISPEAPVPVVHVRDEEQRPGGAGNVALNIAALGASATVLGLTGRDREADELERILAEADVDCAFERIGGCSTVTKLRVMSRNQQLIRLDFEDRFPPGAADGIGARLEGLVRGAGAVVLSDYGKGTLSQVQDLIGRCRAADVPVLVDPKGTDFERYRGATLITPNRSEFEAVVGCCADERDLVERGTRLLESLDLSALLVTRSEQGMTLLRQGHEPLHLPTRAQEVFDVTGAGDTVIAVLASALAAGLDLAQATGLSNVAAGVVVGKLGTSTVSTTELHRALHDPRGEGFGVVGEDELRACLEQARARGESIVMTNGCFDILHAGHVAYLEQARALGDRLVVAVNTDESVRRLDKGEGRPVNALAHRMDVLAALKSVDWVVPFAEDTPERLICRMLPEVLVKGGDYRPEDIAGGGCVRANGGRVEVLSFVDGCSTTGIIEAIRNSEISDPG